MCELYPVVPNCCSIISLRTGMLIISVLTIISGCIALSGIEQKSDVNYQYVKNITHIENARQAFTKLGDIISAGISIMSILLMFAGVMLLVATLTDDEGFAQGFVFVTSFSIIIGFLLIILICVECLFKDTCTLSGMDWLSGFASIVAMVAYLLLWSYFVCVANSHITIKG